MKRSVLSIITGLAALVLCVTICSAGFEPQFEEMPLSVKASDSTKPYNDEGFMTEATKQVNRISNSTVPIGNTLSEITDAYYRLIMENVSPEFFANANNIAAYLYYASQAGEAYIDFHEYQNSVSKTTDGSEYYAVADEYSKASAEYWKNIKGLFPNATMYTLPAIDAPMPEEEETKESNKLEGLEYGMPMSQKEPDPASPDETEKFKTTTSRWFEDYVDMANEDEVDPVTQKVINSAGHLFLTGEGIDWTDSTYMELVSRNVAEDFYEKAQYIDAFFYLLSQARDSYEDYINDRTYVSSVTKGQENFDTAKKYYTEAGKAIGYFEDILPNYTNSTLPDFPEFGEVKYAGDEWAKYGEIGYITTDMAEQLGYTETTE